MLCRLSVYSCLLLAMPAWSTSAATLNVPSGAYPSIQSALDVAADGDEVVVAPGTYSESVVFPGAQIVLRSSGGATQTIVDASTVGARAVDFGQSTDAVPVLDGFTIRGGSATIGAGICAADSAATVRNCTVVGNDGLSTGAVYSAHLIVLEDCTFASNSASPVADGGGGALAIAGSGVVSGCRFSGNSSSNDGGAVFVWAGAMVDMVNCSFLDNSAADDGGAIYVNVDGYASLTACMFDNNVAQGSGWGGGVAAVAGVVDLQSCTFTDNSASEGGGVYVNTGALAATSSTFTGNTGTFEGGGIAIAESTATIEACRFSNNVANQFGGALLVSSAASATAVSCTMDDNRVQGALALGGAGAFVGDSNATAMFANCVFTRNTSPDRGAALYVYEAAADILNCTIGHNNAQLSGAGIYVDIQGDVLVQNSIVWGNKTTGQPASEAIGMVPGGVVAVEYTDIQGGWSGVGNINAAPRFYDGASGNVRLVETSPAIDAGRNLLVPQDTLDLDEDGVTAEPLPQDRDENDRFVDDVASLDTGVGDPPLVDMGAFEFFGECNGNGTPDVLDIVVGTSADTNDNLFPDECEPDCNASGRPDDVDLVGWALDRDLSVQTFGAGSGAIAYELTGPPSVSAVTVALTITRSSSTLVQVAINSSPPLAQVQTPSGCNDNTTSLVISAAAFNTYWDPAATNDLRLTVIRLDPSCTGEGTVGGSLTYDARSRDCNATGLPDECEAVGNGDFNGDGLVDAEDATGLTDCLGGPSHMPTVGADCRSLCLQSFDWDGDLDVDLRDFAAWSRRLE